MNVSANSQTADVQKVINHIFPFSNHGMSAYSRCAKNRIKSSTLKVIRTISRTRQRFDAFFYIF